MGAREELERVANEIEENANSDRYPQEEQQRGWICELRAIAVSLNERASMDALLLAGNGLSNAAYNLSQFDVIAADTRAQLRNAAKKWDEALASHKQEPTK